MDIGAHPHMGLQTVTWLLDGEVAGYSGAAPRCAEPPQVCESEPGELNCWVSTTADLPVVFDSHTRMNRCRLT